MDDLISRKEAITSVKKVITDSWWKEAEEALNSLEAKRKEAWWEFDLENEEWSWDYPFKCSNCGAWNESESPFCPNCGSEMYSEADWENNMKERSHICGK